jgi:hypothetical protein
MKRQLIAMLAAGASLATVANAEIVLTEDLSLYGYIDAAGGDIDLSGDNSYTAIAEFELGFDFTTEPFFANVELSFRGDTNGDGDSDVEFETAIIGYNVSENLSISAGNILSYFGWETYDATGLYQFSYAYRDFSPLYPAYAVGASVDYVTDAYAVGVWVGDSDGGKMSVEVMGKYTGIEGVTLFAAYAVDPGYESYNFWALAMINYAFENNAGLTLRYSVQEDNWSSEDWESITISPSYTFSDNLAGLLELSLVDGASGGADYAWAAELIYTF